jgi:hypothetical protein
MPDGTMTAVYWYELHRATPRYDPAGSNHWSYPLAGGPDEALVLLADLAKLPFRLKICKAGEPVEFVLQQKTRLSQPRDGGGEMVQGGKTLATFEVTRS